MKRVDKPFTIAKTICSIFRLNTNTSIESMKIKIGKFANCTRLLIECVQCYGTQIKDDKTQFYRGIGDIQSPSLA